MLLQPAGVGGQAQGGPRALGQRGRLVLGAPRQAAPQQVGDGRVTALLPALERTGGGGGEREDRWKEKERLEGRKGE